MNISLSGISSKNSYICDNDMCCEVFALANTSISKRITTGTQEPTSRLQNPQPHDDTHQS